MTGALFVLLTLLVGGLGTMGLEHLLRRRAELGAATTPSIREDVKLLDADRWLYPAGTVSALLGVLFALVVIPFGPNLIAEDIGIGAFYFIVVVDFVVLGVALTGWGANTSDAVDAYYRITAQLVAYVVPLGLAYVGAIMMAESLSMVTIVERQASLWFVVLQPSGFALYLVTGLMQAYRAPFMEPFSKFIGGWCARRGRWVAGACVAFCTCWAALCRRSDGSRTVSGRLAGAVAARTRLDAR